MTLRILCSWALYWTGDLVSRTIVNHTFGHYFEWPYRLYSRLMCWACDLQGNDPRGPWELVPPNDGEAAASK